MTCLDALLDWYTTLTPATLVQVDQFYAPQARFKDPFNDVSGVVAIRRLFEHMFDTTDNPRFVMLERIEQGTQAFVTWEFHFALKGRTYTVLGGSHLRFDADGLVIDHRDYWDAAEELFQKLPVIGGPVRWLRRQFAVKPS
ncbi:SnoaL-like domain-containing protein [Andreprevotia lacus DSM 23236]|jgi:hypothetical protein|uniref:SnoaL-like domain-containing protein n=1 Tax=Andreprevotia lacus DSM 23236 TaxID=1121001 RepID=A0A1W1XRK1_9NEIS|nr:nuclear transport factor 2 family protein [Andreprevotia lacus]SMC26151.1 SnoaL-like domain-containing protein [Andreprevotia lacus DSM 23236]